MVTVAEHEICTISINKNISEWLHSISYATLTWISSPGIVKMQLSNLILGILLACIADITNSIKFYEVDVENGTEDELAVLTTTPLFDTLESTSDHLPTDNVLQNLELLDEGQNNKAPSLPTLELPDNHKNETSTPFVSSIELPPVLKQFNTYQEQYKKYYQQKHEYDYKPNRFEANSVRNHYLAQGLGSYLDENDAGHRYEELKHNREPFPYTYENERIPFISQPVWSSQFEGNDVGYNHVQPSKTEGHFPKDEDQSLYGWKKAVKFFTTLLPLGLLLATLTPSVLSINSTTDPKTGKQRSLNEGLDGLKEYFNRVNKMNDPECEKKLICELSRLGKDASGTYFQKSFWFLANETPDDVAEHLGVRELFRRIREGKCESYKCQRKRKKFSARKRLSQASES